MACITLLQSFRQAVTGMSSFKSATKSNTTVQKIVLMTYRSKDITPRTGPGKKLSIVLFSLSQGGTKTAPQVEPLTELASPAERKELANGER